MTKATTITDTATAVDACQQLALTDFALVLGDVFTMTPPDGGSPTRTFSCGSPAHRARRPSRTTTSPPGPSKEAALDQDLRGWTSTWPPTRTSPLPHRPFLLRRFVATNNPVYSRHRIRQRELSTPHRHLPSPQPRTDCGPGYVCSPAPATNFAEAADDRNSPSRGPLRPLQLLLAIDENSATSTSTPTPPSCSSRSSPNEKGSASVAIATNAPIQQWSKTFTDKPSPPPSSTASPTEPTSS